MSEYTKTENSIIFYNKANFHPKHILECGQIFRFYINEIGNYVVLSKDLRAEIEEIDDGYIIHTNNPDYFEKFFNLEVDYSQIKNQILGISPVLDRAMKEAYGLRILKGDLFETIVSFIISANNNIKRIKLIIDRLCKSLGKDMGNYYAFPTVEEFSGADEEFFKSIGAGYRSSYLAEVKDAYNLLIKDNLDAMSDIELRRRLMKIKGVGPKVADCIMLFAFNRKKVFPVDVWMERVYFENFGTQKLSRPQISEFLTNKFGDLSGYVQQYMFYSKTVKSEN